MKETGYRIRNQYLPHFVTFTVVGWVDLFSRKQCRDIVINNLKHCIDHKGLLLYGYVIMTNHVHAIIAAETNTNGLSFLIRDFKSYSSKQLSGWVLGNAKESRREWMTDIFRFYGNFSSNVDLFQVWTHDNRPMVIFTNEFFQQKLEYIHQNPVKAGFVRRPVDYFYSSASNYAGFEENILDVIVIDNWSNIGLIR
jgi:REP element-mobilizing transposase RayT